MSSDLQSALITTHRANVERYRRILGSYLTVEERAFVERRIAEEETALRWLIANRVPTANFTPSHGMHK